MNLERHEGKPWAFAREKLVSSFAENDAERTESLIQELMAIKMKPTESVAAFTARFEKLRRDAKVADDMVMVNRYRNALLPDLADRVAIARAGLSVSAKCSAQQTASLAMSFENTPRDKTSSKVSRRERLHTPSTVDLSTQQGTKRRLDTNGKPKKYCVIHKWSKHDTASCNLFLAAKESEAAFANGVAASRHNPFRSQGFKASSTPSDASTFKSTAL